MSVDGSIFNYQQYKVVVNSFAISSLMSWYASGSHVAILLLGNPQVTWWRHQMETFSALLAICVGNPPVSGEFPAQRPVTRSFDVFFDLCPNKRLGKQSWGWWFDTPSLSLWRHCNDQSPLHSPWQRSSNVHLWCVLCYKPEQVVE